MKKKKKKRKKKKKKEKEEDKKKKKEEEEEVSLTDKGQVRRKTGSRIDGQTNAKRLQLINQRSSTFACTYGRIDGPVTQMVTWSQTADGHCWSRKSRKIPLCYGLETASNDLSPL